jgi:hypothetical protein
VFDDPDSGSGRFKHETNVLAICLLLEISHFFLLVFMSYRLSVKVIGGELSFSFLIQSYLSTVLLL